MMTLAYLAFMMALALALAIILQKILMTPLFTSWSRAIPRLLILLLLLGVVGAIVRHWSDFDTKPEELLLASILAGIFWWVVWFHKARLRSIDSYLD